MGQTSAALGPAASKHLAAIGRAHPLAEPMLLGALTLLGLIGTKHNRGHRAYSTAAVRSAAAAAISAVFTDNKSIIQKFRPHVNINLAFLFRRTAPAADFFLALERDICYTRILVI